MMRLTVAFLAALAAADAAEARTHRHARRQYGSGYDTGYGEVPAVSSKESPKYNPTSAEVFVSSVPSDTYPPTVETPLHTSAYGSGFEEGPEVPEPTSTIDYGNGYGAKPTPEGEGVYPSSEAVPSGVYPSSKPVEGGEVYPTAPLPGTGYQGTGYPGTGYQPSKTPLSDYVSSVATPVPTEYVTSKVPVSEVEECTTETLTYTVGVGSSAHPVVTEVTHTRTSTIYQTITVGKAKPTPEVPAGGEDYPVSSSTITVKSTTTSTKYITVKPTPTSGYEVPAGGQGTPEGEEECAAPATVTVTAKETVYVTKEASKPTAYPEVPAGGEDKPEDEEKPEDEYPAYPPVQPTPSVKYPVPSGNGTYPAGPTGFHTSYKPAYPTGTGYNKPAAETSSLPYFSFVSEPAEPTKTPISNEKPTPDYNNGYGEVPQAESTTAPAYPAIPQETPKESEKPTPSAVPSYGSGYGTY